MKKFILSLAIVCCTYTVFAQPTINAANFNPVENTETQLSLALDTLASTGANGANQTWNYSTLSGGFSLMSTFHSATGKPGASLFNANYCTNSGNDYSYFKIDNDGIRTMGDYNAGAGNVITNASFEYKYPLTYTTNTTDIINERRTDIASGIYDDLKGTRNFKGVGYGTLILPSGTFNNVLKVVITTVDTDYYNGSLYSITHTTNTQWLYPGITGALLISTFTVLEQNGTLSPFPSSGYTSKTPLAINEEVKKNYQFSCFPNPAKNSMNIRFTINKATDARVTILAMNGQAVRHSAPVKATAGLNTFPVNTEGLATGNYIADLNIGGVHIFQQFIKD